MTPRFVLASASPRRRALIEALGIQPLVIHSDVDEDADGTPEQIVIQNARAKRDDVAARLSESALVIAADTIVCLNGAVLGKPVDLHEAREMLTALSGHTHRVLTGLSLIDMETRSEAEGIETTEVTFRTLNAHEIDAFIQAVHPLDRAGAYTVDGPGSLLVEKYNGCYQNVLGLPMVRLDALLRRLNHSLFELMDGNRATFL